MAKLPIVHYWQDPVARSGPDNMAVDSWLLATAEKPVLRAYSWNGDWGSLGYFGAWSVAQKRLPGVALVRRATGGGLVDHRADWTYTLVVPTRFVLARRRGNESYRVIHSALGKALQEVQVATELVAEEKPVGDSPVCFEKPVTWDLVDIRGAKVAGAGQRRTRRGLLHQGSVSSVDSVERSSLFNRLATGLADKVEKMRIEPPERKLAAFKERFSRPDWLQRR